MHKCFLSGQEPSDHKGKQYNTHYNINIGYIDANLLFDVFCKEIPELEKYRINGDENK